MCRRRIVYRTTLADPRELHTGLCASSKDMAKHIYICLEFTRHRRHTCGRICMCGLSANGSSALKMRNTSHIYVGRCVWPYYIRMQNLYCLNPFWMFLVQPRPRRHIMYAIYSTYMAELTVRRWTCYLRRFHIYARAILSLAIFFIIWSRLRKSYKNFLRLARI